MGRNSLRYRNTDYMFACPCGFRYDKCATKTQLQLIYKLHVKTCSVAQNAALHEPKLKPKIVNDGKSETQHIDELLKSFHEADSA